MQSAGRIADLQGNGMRRKSKTRATIERKRATETVWRIESVTLGTYWATVPKGSETITLTTGVRKQPVTTARYDAIIHRVRQAIGSAQRSEEVRGGDEWVRK